MRHNVVPRLRGSSTVIVGPQEHDHGIRVVTIEGARTPGFHRHHVALVRLVFIARRAIFLAGGAGGPERIARNHGLFKSRQRPCAGNAFNGV